jgi:uncharacterized protein DUF938
MKEDARLYAAAAARNREPILDVLRRHLPSRGIVLEVASGSGEHVAHFAQSSGPDLIFQPSDPDPDARVSIDAWATALNLGNPDREGGPKLNPRCGVAWARNLPNLGQFPIGREGAAGCVGREFLRPLSNAARGPILKPQSRGCEGAAGCVNACRSSRPDHSSAIKRPNQLSASQARKSATIAANSVAYGERHHQVMRENECSPDQSQREHRAFIPRRKDGNA